MSDSSSKASAYQQAGVDLDAGERAVSLMKEAVQRSYDARVLAGIGAFGGLFDALALKDMSHPVLVASTDGVGTKTKLAAALGRYEGLGQDIVHHCIGDILVQGALPLFFLDYIASSKLEPDIIATVVTGAANACRAAGIPLLGGETAEMPGVYLEGELDLVGTLVGIIDKANIIDGKALKPGDRILALMSGGLQTNGFSLARHVLASKFHDLLDNSGMTIGEALLVPHRSYLASVKALLDSQMIKGMAHITGGGIPGNLPRILPEGCGAAIQPGSWPVPTIFEQIQAEGDISTQEMFEVFNMGAGFLLLVDPAHVHRVKEQLEEPVFDIGEVTEGEGVSMLESY